MADLQLFRSLNGDDRVMKAIEMLVEAVNSPDEDKNVRLFAAKIVLLLLGRGEQEAEAECEVH